MHQADFNSDVGYIKITAFCPPSYDAHPKQSAGSPERSVSVPDRLRTGTSLASWRLARKFFRDLEWHSPFGARQLPVLRFVRMAVKPKPGGGATIMPSLPSIIR